MPESTTTDYPSRAPRFTLASAGIALLAALAFASPAWAQTAPREGVDYRIVKPPQPVEAPAGKVEVIEFFGYWCPHCDAFEPAMSDWTKKNAATVAVRYLPFAFQSAHIPFQKLYYALDALGKETELRRKVFAAIHGDHTLTGDANSMADFAAKNGIDRKKFIDTFNSFSVQSKVNRANQIAQAYGVDGVPELGIGGKYLLNIAAQTIGSADIFVAKARADKKS